MAKINTLNYQTVASWNGTQDLFVVEQPDGTKVATPAMVKQFIEAGDFEATGEVKDGHGNILKDMAKSADVDAEIGDLSQTGLTGDSVAAQLGTAKGQITGIDNKIAFQLFQPEAGYSSWDDFPYNARGYAYSGQTNNPGFNGFVLCWGSSSIRIQVAFAYNQTAQKYRVFVSGAWGAWSSF